MITVVGSLNTDLIIHVARFPQPGEAIHGENFHTACGGKGANQAYAVARMGHAATMIGCVGMDTFGDAMLNNLNVIGVDTSGVSRRAGVASGTGLITIDTSGQNEIVVAAGANHTLSAEDVRRHAGRLHGSDAVIAQLETPIPSVEMAMSLAREAHVVTVLNPAPYAPLSDDLLRLCDYIIPNENEAANLVDAEVCDVTTAQSAAAKLRERGARNAMVTLGAHGVWLDTQAWCGHVPSYPVKAVDTVAAGDTFIGAFVIRLVEGAPVNEAARFACAAAAISVTRPGAQPSIPSRKEVETFIS